MAFEVLPHGVVAAVALAAHRRGGSLLRQQGAHRPADILHAAVRVVEQTRFLAAAPPALTQRRRHARAAASLAACPEARHDGADRLAVLLRALALRFALRRVEAARADCQRLGQRGDGMFVFS